MDFYFLLTVGIYATIFVITLPVLSVMYLFLQFLIASFCFYVYKTVNKNDPNLKSNPRLFWHWPVTVLATYWYKIGSIFHGKCTAWVKVCIKVTVKFFLMAHRIASCLTNIMIIWHSLKTSYHNKKRVFDFDGSVSNFGFEVSYLI